MKNTLLQITALGAASGILFAAGCSKTSGKERFGGAVDPNAPAVTLAELVAKPEAYDGRDVVVEGLFAGVCGDGDFYFKDKFDIIEANPPSSEMLTRLEKGTPIRLFGLVKARRTGSQAPVGEGGDVELKIVGKAVEVQ